MLWTKLDKREWSARTDKGMLLRIREVGIREDRAFGAYRAGRYLGSDPTLEEAQRRAERGREKARSASPSPAPVPGPENVPTATGKADPREARRQPERGSLSRETVPLAGRVPPSTGHKARGAPDLRKSQFPELRPDTKILLREGANKCAAGSLRFSQYDIAKRSATFSEFKKAGGKTKELLLFVHRGWIALG